MTDIQESGLPLGLEDGVTLSLSAFTDKDLLARLDKAKSGADIVEIDIILDEIERRAPKFSR
jgi:hypothetical protein